MGELINIPKEGRDLYRKNPEIKDDSLTSEAIRIEHKAASESSSLENAIEDAVESKSRIENEIASELETAGCNETRAKLKNKSAALGKATGIIMGIMSSGALFWTLAPSFWNMLWVAGILSFGGGLLILALGDMLLKALSKKLSPRQMTMFALATSLILFSCVLGSSIIFAKSRALQAQLQSTSTDSALEMQDKGIDIEALQKKVETFNRIGLALLFVAWEFCAAYLIFISAKNQNKTKPLVSLIKARDKTRKEILKMKGRQAYLKELNMERIKADLQAELEKNRTKGSPITLIISLIVMIGMAALFFLWSEDAFAAGFKRHVIVCLDVSGSTSRTANLNQQGVLRVIDSLEPGDFIQVLTLNQSSWSAPEYLLSKKMPSSVGFFKSETLNKKRQMIKEFRSAMESTKQSRCSSSLIDGFNLCAELYAGRNSKNKLLYIFSDMQENSQSITPSQIITRPKKILTALKAEAMIPDLSGVSVMCLGVTTERISVKAWKKLKLFWAEFFGQSGADFKAYRIGYNGIPN